MATMSVQIKRSDVRSRPSFLGAVVGRVSYGDQVQTYGGQGAWIKVRLPGQAIEGWLHRSALTTKKIVLRAGDQDVRQAASNDEVALAGKGFNQQVEDAFKSQNPKVDFTWVDEMEKIVVAPQEMQAFLKAGNVTPKGGW
jgi:hypothetical protein